MTRQNTGVEIIGVPNIDDGSDDDRLEFIGNMSTQVSHVLEEPDEFWVAHRVTSNPTVVFVSADGSAEAHVGALGPQGLLERVEALSGS